MIRVQTDKWRQTVEDLRLASLTEPHPRSRERFQALYLIASGQSFIGRINRDPVALVDRLWPKFELDPEFEAKLLVPS